MMNMWQTRPQTVIIKVLIDVMPQAVAFCVIANYMMLVSGLFGKITQENLKIT